MMHLSVQHYSRRVFLIPPFYFGFSILLSLALFLAVPQAGIGLSVPCVGIGLVAAAVGLILVSQAFFLFRSSGASVTFERSAELVTSGPYRISRNPMYLGMLLCLCGLVVALGNVAALAGPVLFFGVIEWMFLPYEEEKMAQELGEPYQVYCTRVRRWL